MKRGHTKRKEDRNRDDLASEAHISEIAKHLVKSTNKIYIHKLLCQDKAERLPKVSTSCLNVEK